MSRTSVPPSSPKTDQRSGGRGSALSKFAIKQNKLVRVSSSNDKGPSSSQGNAKPASLATASPKPGPVKSSLQRVISSKPSTLALTSVFAANSGLLVAKSNGEMTAPKTTKLRPDGKLEVYGPVHLGLQKRYIVPNDPNILKTQSFKGLPTPQERSELSREAGKGFASLTLPSGKTVQVQKDAGEGYIVRNGAKYFHFTTMASLRENRELGGRLGDQYNWKQLTLANGQKALVANSSPNQAEVIATQDIDLQNKKRPAVNARFQKFAGDTSQDAIKNSSLLGVKPKNAFGDATSMVFAGVTYSGLSFFSSAAKTVALGVASVNPASLVAMVSKADESKNKFDADLRNGKSFWEAAGGVLERSSGVTKAATDQNWVSQKIVAGADAYQRGIDWLYHEASSGWQIDKKNGWFQAGNFVGDAAQFLIPGGAVGKAKVAGNVGKLGKIKQAEQAIEAIRLGTKGGPVVGKIEQLAENTYQAAIRVRNSVSSQPVQGAPAGSHFLSLESFERAAQATARNAEAAVEVVGTSSHTGATNTALRVLENITTEAPGAHPLVKEAHKILARHAKRIGGSRPKGPSPKISPPGGGENALNFQTMEVTLSKVTAPPLPKNGPLTPSMARGRRIELAPKAREEALEAIARREAGEVAVSAQGPAPRGTPPAGSQTPFNYESMQSYASQVKTAPAIPRQGPLTHTMARGRKVELQAKAREEALEIVAKRDAGEVVVPDRRAQETVQHYAWRASKVHLKDALRQVPDNLASARQSLNTSLQPILRQEAVQNVISQGASLYLGTLSKASLKIQQLSKFNVQLERKVELLYRLKTKAASKTDLGKVNKALQDKSQQLADMNGTWQFKTDVVGFKNPVAKVLVEARAGLIDHVPGLKRLQLLHNSPLLDRMELHPNAARNFLFHEHQTLKAGLKPNFLGDMRLEVSENIGLAYKNFGPRTLIRRGEHKGLQQLRNATDTLASHFEAEKWLSTPIQNGSYYIRQQPRAVHALGEAVEHLFVRTPRELLRRSNRVEPFRVFVQNHLEPIGRSTQGVVQAGNEVGKLLINGAKYAWAPFHAVSYIAKPALSVAGQGVKAVHNAATPIFRTMKYGNTAVVTGVSSLVGYGVATGQARFITTGTQMKTPDQKALGNSTLMFDPKPTSHQRIAGIIWGDPDPKKGGRYAMISAGVSTDPNVSPEYAKPGSGSKVTNAEFWKGHGSDPHNIALNRSSRTGFLGKFALSFDGALAPNTRIGSTFNLLAPSVLTNTDFISLNSNGTVKANHSYKFELGTANSTFKLNLPATGLLNIKGAPKFIQETPFLGSSGLYARNRAEYGIPLADSSTLRVGGFLDTSDPTMNGLKTLKYPSNINFTIMGRDVTYNPDADDAKAARQWGDNIKQKVADLFSPLGSAFAAPSGVN